MFKKVNKQKARRLYNEGTAIHLVPCKVIPDYNSNWVRPFKIQYTDDKRQQDKQYPNLAFENTFDSHVNSYAYYNCNSELGEYIHYYIEE